MCLVASWSFAEDTLEETKSHPEIRHMEEALVYRFAESRVDILLTIIMSYAEGPPLSLHLTLRQGIVFEDATRTLLTGGNCIADLLRSTRADELDILGSDAAPVLAITPLASASDGRGVLRGRIPLAELNSHELLFASDWPEGALVDVAKRPFTTCTYSPINPSADSLAIRVSIAITGSAFLALVHKVNQYGWKYYYDVAGPAIVLRDLRLDDLYHAPADVRELYMPIFEKKVKATALEVPSYDVITFDRAGSVCQYTRVMAHARHVIQNSQHSYGTELGEKWSVNGWHCSAPDFLILRTGLIRAAESEEDMENVATSFGGRDLC